ncbi:MAG TPA: hypothetical protein PLL78_04065 [Fimbriimonadaceae bacterium]|nr:hypothetical protein [Fimbriimonadaceae bacterium]HRJ95837.1 hypothetical protein [Fimbriimonadaceae bacterium]
MISILGKAADRLGMGLGWTEDQRRAKPARAVAHAERGRALSRRGTVGPG